MHLDLSLSHDNVSSDPCLASFALCSVQECIDFTKDTLSELSIKIIPVLQKMIVPLSPSYIQAFNVKALHPVEGYLASANDKVSILEKLFLDKLSLLEYLYSAVSGGPL